MHKYFLATNDSVLVVVDIQVRLAAVMSERQKVIGNSLHLIEAARILRLPVLLTEQYPKGLGPTVPEIKEALPSYEPIEKLVFGCCGERAFMEALYSIGKRKVILCGMETHVCVLQTCLGLIREGYTVHVVQDAICSRTKENHGIGTEFMRDAGGVLTGTETVLFQLLERAGTEEFKLLSKRIR
ncbi:MAG TPA: hydrolase [Thermodesulfovibrionales bacterium]|nr:hydrolase [Thermodesulfovibrionales bacterium]